MNFGNSTNFAIGPIAFLKEVAGLKSLFNVSGEIWNLLVTLT